MPFLASVGTTLFFMAWWQRQMAMPVPKFTKSVLEEVYVGLVLAVVYVWLKSQIPNLITIAVSGIWLLSGRWTAGFVIFMESIVRVFLVDVRQLETIFRILSFLVLGADLIASGFVYKRFASTLRKWIE
jgi:hypothetical protein